GGSNAPHFLLNGEPARPGLNPRDELARLLTNHIQFSRAFTNRIWSELMGFGIVEPVDEFDLARFDPKNPPPAPWTIQPSNPELLDELARDFVNNGYDLKELMREITNSQAYQLSSRYDGTWDPAYTRYYARHLIRRLESEELADSVV